MNLTTPTTLAAIAQQMSEPRHCYIKTPCGYIAHRDQQPDYGPNSPAYLKGEPIRFTFLAAQNVCHEWGYPLTCIEEETP
jgi:hypothetical protein